MPPAPPTDSKQPRINFLTDPFTSRDIFGVVRGRCYECDQCGRYLKATSEYTISPLEKGRMHPDNDPRLTKCTRCGCLAQSHEVVEHENAKELGNDSFALGDYDAAVVQYSKALQLQSADPVLWSNRAAAYLAKGWYAQALHDADHALSLRPEWSKAWGRKAAAHHQLGQNGLSVEAYRRGLQLDPSNAALQLGLREAQQAQQMQHGKQQPVAQQREQVGTVGVNAHAAASKPVNRPAAVSGPPAADSSRTATVPAPSVTDAHLRAVTLPISRATATAGLEAQTTQGSATPSAANVAATGGREPTNTWPLPRADEDCSGPSFGGIDFGENEGSLGGRGSVGSAGYDSGSDSCERSMLETWNEGSKHAGSRCQGDGTAASLRCSYLSVASDAHARANCGAPETATTTGGKIGLQSLMSLLNKQNAQETCGRQGGAATARPYPPAAKPDGPGRKTEGTCPPFDARQEGHETPSEGSELAFDAENSGNSAWEKGSIGQEVSMQQREKASSAAGPGRLAALAKEWEDLQQQVQNVVGAVQGLQQQMRHFKQVMRRHYTERLAAAGRGRQGEVGSEGQAGMGVSGIASTSRTEQNRHLDLGIQASSGGGYGGLSNAEGGSSSPPTTGGHALDVVSSGGEEEEGTIDVGPPPLQPPAVTVRKGSAGAGRVEVSVTAEEQLFKRRAGSDDDDEPSDPILEDDRRKEEGVAGMAGAALSTEKLAADLSHAVSAGALDVEAADQSELQTGPSFNGSSGTRGDVFSPEVLHGDGSGSNSAEWVEVGGGASDAEEGDGTPADARIGSHLQPALGEGSSAKRSGSSGKDSSGNLAAEEPSQDPSAATSTGGTASEDGRPLQAEPDWVEEVLKSPAPRLGSGERKGSNRSVGDAGGLADVSENASVGSEGSADERENPGSPQAKCGDMSTGKLVDHKVSATSPFLDDSTTSEVLQQRQKAVANAPSGSEHVSSSSDSDREVSDARQSDSEGGSSAGSESEVEDDQEWLQRVEEARRKLASATGVTAGSGGGSSVILPPTKGGRRMPKTPGTTQDSSTSGTPGSLSLASLQSLVDGASSSLLRRRKDPHGVLRVACTRCGAGQCPQYIPYSLEGLVVGGACCATPLGMDAARVFETQRLCAVCGCDCASHETEKEGDLREVREMRARQRSERQAQQQGATGGPATMVQARFAVEADSLEARRRRVAAAAVRRRAAEEGGEPLQTSDCDVLTQARRGECGACRDCKGFCIHFRSSDANDPEVMFYCSHCGCRADAHNVDRDWEQQEAERKQREVAAAQRAKQAQHAASAQRSAVARQEVEAFSALGLPLGADKKSIARAYKRLALQLHPDKQQQQDGTGEDSVGETATAAVKERFIKVAAAYKFLTERVG